MKRLLAVFAHPDDETAIAGTLAHYAGQGVRLSLICTTLGEAGEISDPALATPENLGQVREAELRCSCAALGIDDLHLLGYCDSGMDGTPENEKATSFIRANPDEVVGKLVRLIRQIRPHVVITFEPNGWYGHPDHIATGRHASRAYELSGRADAFPEAGPIWQPQRLYHAAFLRSRFRELVEYARQQGLDTSMFEQFSWDEPDPLADQITHVLDVLDYFEVTKASRACHRTQINLENPIWNMPDDLMRGLMGRDHFIQVHPAPDPAAAPVDDLFAGVSD